MLEQLRGQTADLAGDLAEEDVAGDIGGLAPQLLKHPLFAEGESK